MKSLKELGRIIPREILFTLTRDTLTPPLKRGDKLPMQLKIDSHSDHIGNILWYEGHVRGNEYLSTQRFGGFGYTHEQAVQELHDWLIAEGYIPAQAA